MQSQVLWFSLGLQRLIRFAIHRHLRKGLSRGGALAIASPTGPLFIEKQDAHQKRAYHTLVAMSSSDDDMPLARGIQSNGLSNGMTQFSFTGLPTLTLVPRAAYVVYHDVNFSALSLIPIVRFLMLMLPFFISGNGHKSKDIIPKSLDKALDKANPAPKNAAPGISIRNGPVVEMDIDGPTTNGLGTKGTDNGKRKARNSAGNRKSYKEATDDDDEDEKPLVCSTKG